MDNARIEMEGGNEVPVIDGSALGWLVALEETGLKEALFGKRERAKRVRVNVLVSFLRIHTCYMTAVVCSEMLSSATFAFVLHLHYVIHAFIHTHALQMVWMPTRPVTVLGSNGAFVQMVPDPMQRVTAGVDTMPLAPVVGQKWFTWTPAHDAEAFRWDVGPARPFAPSIQVPNTECALAFCPCSCCRVVQLLGNCYSCVALFPDTCGVPMYVQQWHVFPPFPIDMSPISPIDMPPFPIHASLIPPIICIPQLFAFCGKLACAPLSTCWTSARKASSRAARPKTTLWRITTTMRKAPWSGTLTMSPPGTQWSTQWCVRSVWGLCRVFGG